MSRHVEFGERLFFPVYARAPSRLYEEDPEAPKERPLWVYVLDPACTGLRNATAQLSVPYEPLQDGLKGAFFEVPEEPLPTFVVKHLDWPDRLVDDYNNNPLNLDDPRLAMSAGMLPSTGQPRFAAQMVYAVCQCVYTTFRHALGRFPTWGPWMQGRLDRGESTALRLRPFASKEANACYDSDRGTLEFGVFRSREDTASEFILPGGTVMLALSHDVIAHEVTHALLDGMRAHFRINTHPDVAAFHEGFADIVALFHHFHYRDLVVQAIEEHGTVDADMLLQLARQFGEAVHGIEGGALRRAVRGIAGDNVESQEAMPSYSQTHPRAPHERGGILVAAVFSAYLSVYKRRAHSLIRLVNLTGRGRGKWMPSELIEMLADEACRLAGDFLQVCIRAVDYCPPLDVRFGDYLRAMVTADRMLDPEDKDGIRDALIKSFRQYDIDLGNVRDISEYSLEWNSPYTVDRPRIRDLEWSALRFRNDGLTPLGIDEIERQATALGEFVIREVSRDKRLARDFGIRPVGGQYGPLRVESIRPVVRRSRHHGMRHGLVAELAQHRTAPTGSMWGGSTVIIDPAGRIQFAIRKTADDERIAEQAEFLRSGGGQSILSFRQLHSE
jgi:hypothetical protein